MGTLGSLTIQVDVSTLLDTLATNREKHITAYNKAKKGYLKLLRRELEKKLENLTRKETGVRGRIKAFSNPNGSEADLTRITHQPPRAYTEFYDQAIEMLEYADNQTVELNQQQFQEFVKDEWNWKAQFTTSNVAYAAAAR